MSPAAPHGQRAGEHARSKRGGGHLPPSLPPHAQPRIACARSTRGPTASSAAHPAGRANALAAGDRPPASDVRRHWLACTPGGPRPFFLCGTRSFSVLRAPAPFSWRRRARPPSTPSRPSPLTAPPHLPPPPSHPSLPCEGRGAATTTHRAMWSRHGARQREVPAAAAAVGRWGVCMTRAPPAGGKNARPDRGASRGGSPREGGRNENEFLRWPYANFRAMMQGWLFSQLCSTWPSIQPERDL